MSNLLNELRKTEVGERGLSVNIAADELIKKLKRRRTSNSSAQSNIKVDVLENYLNGARKKLLSSSTDTATINEASPSTIAIIGKTQEIGRLPQHLQQLKADLDYMQDTKIQLPVVRVMSPRSLRKASRLPPPNSTELARMEQIAGLGVEPTGVQDAYRNLIHVTDKQRRRQQRAHLQSGTLSVERAVLRQETAVNPGIRRLSMNTVAAVTSTSGAHLIMSGAVHPPAKSSATEMFERPQRIRERRDDLERSIEAMADASVAIPHSIAATAAATTTRQNVDGKEVQEMDSLVAGVWEELGVDLDPRYNKLRRVFKGVQVIAFFWRRLALMYTFSRLSSQTKLSTISRRRDAMCLVVRVGRGYLARVHVREVRRHAALQAETLRLLISAQAWRRLKLCINIALIFVRRRRVLRNFRYKRAHGCVLRIQCTWRGHQARRRFREVTRQLHRRRSAARNIQCAWRQYVARRKLAIRRKIHAVRQKQHQLVLAEEIHLAALYGALKRNGAALLISRAFTASVIRERLHTLVFWNHVEKAVTIQRYVRGYLQRTRNAHLLQEEAARQRRRHAMAVKIQAVVRGHVRRQAYYVHRQIDQETKKKNRMLQKLMAFSKNDLVLNKFRRQCREFRDKYQPFRYLQFNRSATDIQRAWRGHKGRKHAHLRKIYHRLFLFYDGYFKPRRSAVLIQRILRGYLQRKRIRRLKLSAKATRIQSIFRGYSARAQLEQLKRQRASSRVLQHFVASKLLSKRLMARLHLRRRFRLVYRIQRLARVFVGRRHMRQLRIKQRLEAETLFAEGLRVTQLLSEFQLQILFESSKRPIGRAVAGVCGEECPGSGVFQALFVQAVGSKARRDKEALSTNKLDMKRVGKLLDRIPGLRLPTEGAAKDSLKRRKSTGVGAMSTKPCLPYDIASALRYEIFVLPQGTAMVSTTDLDLIYSKCHSSRAVGKGLSYSELTVFMEEVATRFFGDLTTATDSIGSSAGVKGVKARDRISQAELSSPPYLGLALLVRLLSAMHGEEWFRPPGQWLVKESRARLAVYVRRIQAMVRRKLANRMRELFRQAMDRQRLVESYARRVVLVQSLIRRYIDRLRAIRKAQVQLVQYIPFDGSPSYWHNPTTRVSKYTKPRVLGPYECRVLPLCAPGFETVVKCCNCGQLATLNCNGCLESYCGACWESLHCKGSKRAHTTAKISMCSYCTTQMASKCCTLCEVSAPDKLSASVLMRSRRGLYCDTCWAHFHEPQDAQQRRQTHFLLHQTKDLFLVKQQLARKPATTHRAASLVQCCEECLWRAASLRCLTCDQVYCAPCLSALHARGLFSKHAAELLPYYTADMHAKYLKDAALRVERERVDEVCAAYADMFRTWFRESVLRVQTWWRRIFYARRGRARMRAVRLAARTAYRLRKSDDLHFRSKAVYTLKDVFGMNARLRSDTREEAALGRVTVFERQRAREYIWRNKEDWGHYVKSRTEPKKGVPKTGFAVGDIDELIDQARHGGWRLPGRMVLDFGSSEARATLDLEQFELTNNFVRIRSAVYIVKEVDGSRIVFDRKVHQLSVSPEGEVMYLLPSRLSDRRSIYFLLRYATYDTLVEYNLSQAALRVYCQTLRGSESVYRRLARVHQALENADRADRWIRRAEAVHGRYEHALKYVRVKSKAQEERERKEQRVPTRDNPINALTGALHEMGGDKDNTPWIATHDQLEERLRREAAMSEEELMADAELWVEDVNPLSRETCYIHRETREMVFAPPASVERKREKESAAEKARTLQAKRQKMNKLAVSFKQGPR